MKDGGFDETPVVITDAIHHDKSYNEILKIATKSMNEIAEIVAAMKDADGVS